MLETLHVKNLALIEETEVSFKKGLNILTGETGAGKSILLGALNLALGEKANSSFLRSGSEEALVEAVFLVDSKEEEKLRQVDLESEDGEIILSRKVSEDGKSVAKINGERVNLSKLKEAAEILLDIHGQHDHQSLLKASKHIEILDSYIGEEIVGIKSQLKDIVRNIKEIDNELSESDIDEARRIRDIDFYNHEIEEIRNANLKVGEDEELEAEFKRLSNADKIINSLAEADRELSGDMGANSAVDRALRKLDQVSDYDDNLKQAAKSLADVSDILNDAARIISDYIDSADDESELFNEVQNRLDLVNNLKNKYGRTIEEIFLSLEEKEAALDKLINSESYIKELKVKKEELEKKAEVLCGQLSDIRKNKAGELSALIKQNLEDLSFLGVEFSMNFEKTFITSNGFDKAIFMISVNPGEPVKRLDQIASGGEISRIMLAIKSVLASEDEIGTLVFDEIDTGVGGQTANAVAEKLNLISKEHQVICITHLHQIAAMADTHFLIEKSIQSDATISDIRPLSEKEEILEITRMLGGDENSPAYETAIDLKNKAKRKK